jgi:hypothetical protein
MVRPGLVANPLQKRVMMTDMRLRRISAALLSGVLASCSGTRQREAPIQPEAVVRVPASDEGVESEPRPLEFAWPIGASAVVTEDVLKKGRRATMRYRIVTERRDDEILVYYRDFEFLKIEAVEMSDPAVRAIAERLGEEIMATMPPYRIGLDGQWIGIADLDELFTTAAKFMPKMDSKRLAEFLDTPGMREAIDGKLSEVWVAWVEAWIGLALRPGERIEGVSESTVMGQTIAMPTVFEHLGAAADQVWLRVTSTHEGEDAAAALRELSQELVANVADASSSDTVADMLKDLEVRRVVVMEAKIDARTMLPSVVSSNERSTVEAPGFSRERVEEHLWTFAWD